MAEPGTLSCPVSAPGDTRPMAGSSRKTSLTFIEQVWILQLFGFLFCLSCLRVCGDDT